MQNNKLVSIIIPIYNSEAFLIKCLDSIVNQTYRNLEIILIDDGSTDCSLNICEKYKEIDNRIKIIHKENGGQASARNAGLDIASGDYIEFVDSDDWIDLELCEKFVDYIADNDLVVCGRYNVDEKSGAEEPFFISDEPIILSQEETIRKFLLTDMIDGSPCDKLFKRELIGNLRFPIGLICEDLPFVYSYLKKCTNVFHIGKPMYFYLQRTNSTSKSTFSNKTYGLIKYSKEISSDVKGCFPHLQKEADIYYSSRLFHFLKIYFNSNTKDKILIKYRIRDFKYLSAKERTIAVLMKLHLYKITKKALGR